LRRPAGLPLPVQRCAVRLRAQDPSLAGCLLGCDKKHVCKILQ